MHSISTVPHAYRDLIYTKRVKFRITHFPPLNFRHLQLKISADGLANAHCTCPPFQVANPLDWAPLSCAAHFPSCWDNIIGILSFFRANSFSSLVTGDSSVHSHAVEGLLTTCEWTVDSTPVFSLPFWRVSQVANVVYCTTLTINSTTNNQ